MAAHQDDIPSTSSRPSASASRTPAASVTSNDSWVPGIGPYGCQTCAWSSFSRSSTRRTLREAYRQREQTADQRAVTPRQRLGLGRELDAGEALQQRRERHVELQPGQRG